MRKVGASDIAAADSSDAAVGGWTRAAARSRVVVAALLITAGVVWALVRGLEFYGLNPVHIAYDLDQPPLLLMFVGAWLFYRSRPRLRFPTSRSRADTGLSGPCSW